MGWANSELRAFYEAEAQARNRYRCSPVRRRLTAEFTEVLHAEHRETIVDFGAGPGLDIGLFADAGIAGIGVDLAVRNGRLAAEHSRIVTAASITDAPLRDNAFDAGWSMSTLMHLEPDAMRAAVHELARVLRPGAPARIGLWGSAGRGSRIDDTTIPGHQRPFHHRSAEDNGAIIAAAFGSIADHRVLEIEDAWSDYQIFDVRTPGPATATSVKGVLRFGDDVVLLANERDEWELPGGQPDPGETHGQTLRREFLEELSIDVEVGGYVDTWTYEPLPGRLVTIHTYEVAANDPGELHHSDEHQAVGRFDLDRLDDVALPDGYSNSIRAAVELE